MFIHTETLIFYGLALIGYLVILSVESAELEEIYELEKRLNVKHQKQPKSQPFLGFFILVVTGLGVFVGAYFLYLFLSGKTQNERLKNLRLFIKDNNAAEQQRSK